MRFVFTLCSLLAAGFSFGNPLDSIRAEQRDEGLVIIHQVEEQETLYSIARRYGGSVQGIIKYNSIEDNRIEIGQIIQVLVEKEKSPVSVETTSKIGNGIHQVAMGETLYSISKMYDVKLKDLRRWNDLEGNNISPGMNLKVSSNVSARVLAIEVKEPADTAVLSDPMVEDSAVINPFEGYEKYLVQTGETLSSIASKITVTMDSLRFWNDLESDFLKIGQLLYYKGGQSDSAAVVGKSQKNIRSRINEDGFEKVYEEGVASVIEAMNTSRYLALHRTLPIGTNLEVRNLMNNQVVHVKVIGRLPDTGLNKNILLRLSQPAYDQLGILDLKSRVEVAHFK